MKFLLSEHLYEFEGSQVADQWLQAVDEDGFVKFEPKAGRLGIQIQEEQLALNHHLTPLRLSQLSLLLDICAVQFQAWEYKMKNSSGKECIMLETQKAG